MSQNNLEMDSKGSLLTILSDQTNKQTIRTDCMRLLVAGVEGMEKRRESCVFCNGVQQEVKQWMGKNSFKKKDIKGPP